MNKKMLLITNLSIVLLNANSLTGANNKTINISQKNNITNVYFEKVIKILDYVKKLYPKINDGKKLNLVISYTKQIIDNISDNEKKLNKKEKKEILKILKEIVKESKQKKIELLNNNY